MADVTISSLSRDIPSGSSIIPYSTSNSTLGATVSSIFQDGSIIGIGTTTPSMPDEGYPVKSGIELKNNIVTGIKFSGQKGYSYIRHADNNVTSNFIIDADHGDSSSGTPELLLNVKKINVINIRTNKVTISQPVEVLEDVKAKNTPKMWVSFDGTRNTSGAVSITNTNRLIKQSGGISSVTRTGLGQYRINFSQATVDTNYFIIANGMCDIGTRTVNVQPANGTFTVNDVTVASVLNNDASTYDAPIISVLIFKG